MINDGEGVTHGLPYGGYYIYGHSGTTIVNGPRGI